MAADTEHPSLQTSVARRHSLNRKVGLSLFAAGGGPTPGDPIGLGLTADEKAEAAQQGAREPGADGLGAKDAKPPLKEDMSVGYS